MKPIVESEIIKIVNKFDKHKSAGQDDISNYIVKKLQMKFAVHRLPFSTSLYQLEI